MAEIRNRENFSFGRPALPGLTCAWRKSACTEIALRFANVGGHWSAGAA